jgi:hypothetical protein
MMTIDKHWRATVLVAGLLACFAAVDSAQAQRERGGGGGGGSRQAAQSGQRSAPAKAAAPTAGTRSTATVSNTRADARTTNVRNTSVNNVNVNRNVNVEVEGGGCCNNGWDNDHPVATAAAVGATIAVTSAVIGSIVNKPPANCVPVNYGGIVYQQCGSTWYQPQGAQYVVVAPPY